MLRAWLGAGSVSVLLDDPVLRAGLGAGSVSVLPHVTALLPLLSYLLVMLLTSDGSKTVVLTVQTHCGVVDWRGSCAFVLIFLVKKQAAWSRSFKCVVYNFPVSCIKVNDLSLCSLKINTDGKIT